MTYNLSSSLSLLYLFSILCLPLSSTTQQESWASPAWQYEARHTGDSQRNYTMKSFKSEVPRTRWKLSLSMESYWYKGP